MLRENSGALVVLDAPLREQRSDAAANRRRILAAAEQLFAQRGVAAVSMAEIARTAGVGQGTLYRNFANKGELCLALLDTQMADFQNRVLEALREMAYQGKPWLEQAGWFLEALVLFNAQHIPLLFEAQREIAAGGGLLGSPLQWQRVTVSALLGRAARSGELKAGLDLPVAADLLLAFAHPPVFHFLTVHAQYAPQQIISALRQMLRLLAA